MDASSHNVYDSITFQLNECSEKLHQYANPTSAEEVETFWSAMKPVIDKVNSLGAVIQKNETELPHEKLQVSKAAYTQAKDRIKEIQLRLLHASKEFTQKGRIVSEFQRAIESQYEELEGQMVGKKTGYKTTLSRVEMNNLIDKVSSVAVRLKESEYVTHQFNENLEMLIHKAPGDRVEVLFLPKVSLLRGSNADKELFLREHYLGRGTFGETFAAHSFTNEERVALKFVLMQPSDSRLETQISNQEELAATIRERDEVVAQGRSGIFNAYTKMRYIESRGGGSFFLGPRFHFVTRPEDIPYHPFASLAGSPRDFTLGGALVAMPRGICDLSKANEPNGPLRTIRTEDLFASMGPLFDALVFMKENNLIHGDIADENIVVVQEKDKPPRLAFIDLDEMSFLAGEGVSGPNVLDVTRPMTRIKSPGYEAVGTSFHHMTPEDQVLLTKAVTEQNQGDYNKAQFSREVMSLGMSLKTIFFNQGVNKLPAQLQQKINALYQGMTAAPSQRITAEQARALYLSIMDDFRKRE